MHTIQHPFFLTSSRGDNLSADGSSFEVRLNPPLRIPREAMHTRVYCNQASCLYSFPNNVTTGTLTLRTDAGTADAGTGYVPLEYILTVPPGLYSGLQDVENALAASAIAQGMRASGVDITDVKTFQDNVLRLEADTVTSRAVLTVKSQGTSVLLDPTTTRNDILVGLLGFAATQANNGGILSPQQKGWKMSANPSTGQVLRSRVQFFWTVGGTEHTQEIFIPSHAYTADAYRAAVNAELAAGRTNPALTAIPGGTNLRMTALAVASSASVNTTMSDSSVSPGFGDTVLFYSPDGATKTYVAQNPGTFDKVRSLQISCPGLASGVHVNDESGSSTICRFPINAAPGELIQFDPINPIKNTRDMSGDMLSSFRVQLQDQLAQPIDTAGESYNVVIIIEYDLARGTKTSGGLQ